MERKTFCELRKISSVESESVNKMMSKIVSIE